jgi:hypothetical protein
VHRAHPWLGCTISPRATSSGPAKRCSSKPSPRKRD